MTDYWPQEEGGIWATEGTLIVPCYPDGTVLECSCVKFGTTVAGRISVAQSTVMGDAIGVALKYATVGAPERIPVMLHGIVKFWSGLSTIHVVTAGIGVMNSIVQVVVCTHAVTGYTDAFNAMFLGDSHTLGMAMQTQITDSDEVLIHVGHSL
jgi:hypothetical protein